MREVQSRVEMNTKIYNRYTENVFRMVRWMGLEVYCVYECVCAFIFVLYRAEFMTASCELVYV